MNDDYIFDGSGKPDPEVERLERLLGSLRHSMPAPDFSLVELEPEPPTLIRRILRSHWTKLAVAALLIIVVSMSLLLRRITIWAIEPTSGMPIVSGAAISEARALRAGDAIVTDDRSRAQIRVGAIGTVDVDPESRLRVLDARATHQHLELEQGRIRALITAPPRIFLVDTPAGSAIDLGCAYTLEVDHSGNGLLQVTLGWVALENGREAYVPAGAMCRTHAGLGPGTPVFEDAPEELRRAVDRLDFEVQTPQRRREDLSVVLRLARTRDLITLWHLLDRTNGSERGLVARSIGRLIDLPPDVTTPDLARGDPDAIRRLGRELGIRETNWWRSFFESLTR